MTSRACPLIYCSVMDTAGNEQRLLEQSPRIESLVYTDSEAKADKCVLTVDNFDLSNFDDPVWSHRNLVKVQWGYAGAMALQRTLIITKVTGFQKLQVTARALSVAMDADKKSRTFAAMTRSDVVTKIAAEYGYTGPTAHIQPTGTRYEHVTQARISDAQLLVKLAHAQGYQFWVDHTGLHWHERQLIQEPVRTFTWFRDPGRGDVMDIMIEKDITKRPKEVTRVARDADTRANTAATASDTTDPKRDGLGSILIIKADDLKTAALENSYEPTDTNMSIDNSPPGVAAKRAYRNAQRGAIKVDMSCVGDAAFLAKCVYTLQGVGTRLSGNYYAHEVTHNVGAGSYKMTVKGRSDGEGPPTRHQVPVGEHGLPQVTPTASHAVVNTGTGPIDTFSGADPASLVPVILKDAEGNEIGTSYAPRSPSATAIVDGALKSVED